VWEFFELTEVAINEKKFKKAICKLCEGVVWRMVEELAICSTISKPSIQLRIRRLFQEKLVPHRGKLLLVNSGRPALLHG